MANSSNDVIGIVFFYDAIIRLPNDVVVFRLMSHSFYVDNVEMEVRVCM